MKSEVKIKSSMNYDAVAELLENLIGSFKEGTVCIEKGDDFVTLTPGKAIDLKIEAARSLKKNKQKLAIEMSWSLDEPEEAKEIIKISSQEPEIQAPLPVEETAAEESGETPQEGEDD